MYLKMLPAQQWPFCFSLNGSIKEACGITPGLILGLGPANERMRYFVTTSLIGWAQA